MQLQIGLARRCLFSLFSIWLLATVAWADEGPGQFQLLPDLGGLNSAAPDANLQVTARVRIAANSRVGMLEVTATMHESWHVYSITQPPGGPMKTTIKLAPSKDYRLLGSFAPDRAAHVHFIDVFEMDAEEHPGLFYPSTGDFIAFVGNYKSRKLVKASVAAFRRHAKFPSEGAAVPAVVPGIGWSDHWSFWQAGFPALMVTDTAPFRYPHYHQATDTPDKIDYDRMCRVVSGLEGVVRELAK